jgi:hypothetical protein
MDEKQDKEESDNQLVTSHGVKPMRVLGVAEKMPKLIPCTRTTL